jgi:hypothetical protein
MPSLARTESEPSFKKRIVLSLAAKHHFEFVGDYASSDPHRWHFSGHDLQSVFRGDGKGES